MKDDWTLEKYQEEINQVFEKLKQEMRYVDTLRKIAETKTVEQVDSDVKEAVERICEYFTVSVGRVYAGNGGRGRRVDNQVAKARKIISWVLSEHTFLSYTELGSLYGKGWSHQSVKQYLQKGNDDIDFYRNKGKDTNGTMKQLPDLGIEIR